MAQKTLVVVRGVQATNANEVEGAVHLREDNSLKDLNEDSRSAMNKCCKILSSGNISAQVDHVHFLSVRFFAGERIGVLNKICVCIVCRIDGHDTGIFVIDPSMKHLLCFVRKHRLLKS